MQSPNIINDFLAKGLDRSLPQAFTDFAHIIAKGHPGTVAILTYGSVLRGAAPEETLIDYYLLTEDLSGVSPNYISQAACGLLPPNVYYAETEIAGQTFRAKYAVMTLKQFRTWMELPTNNPYFWARFAQPTALLYTRDEAARAEVFASIWAAITTCYANALGVSVASDPLAIWAEGFAATYASELRAETHTRARQIVDNDAYYYSEATRLIGPTKPHRVSQYWRRITGKGLSVLRLCKAAFTFQGGADYLAWKIERHSGVKIELTDWQRRHPIIAGVWMLLALRRKGAIR